MSRIYDLVAELCPDGVPYKRVDEIATLHRGKALAKRDVGTGAVPIILYGELYTTYGDYITEVVSKAAPDRATLGRQLQRGDILMPMTSTTKDAAIGKASALVVGDPVYLGGDAIALRHNQEPGYLVHLLNSPRFEVEKLKHRSGTTVSHLSPSGIMGLEIPIPPLEVQQEIVRILDQFAELKAELESELKARRNQYEHYRNELLTFAHDTVRWVPLGEVFQMRNGYTPSKANLAFWEQGTLPWFRIEDIRANGRKLSWAIQSVSMEAIKGGKTFPKNSILISTSATVGEYAVVSEEHLANQRFVSLHPNHAYAEEISPSYLTHLGWLISKFCLANATDSGSFPSISNQKLATVTIPIPSLAVQNAVSDVLDTFDSLVNDTAVGLPAEIEARRKQYEFYRDKLLTFPEVAK